MDPPAHRILARCSLPGPPPYPEVDSSIQEPINEIKVSISQLWRNNSEGRRLEAERTSAKFISSGPGVLRPGHTSLFHPEPLNKASARLILFSVRVSFLDRQFPLIGFILSRIYLFIFTFLPPPPPMQGCTFFFPNLALETFII